MATIKRNNMTKYIATGVAVLLFFGLAFWVIRNEGRRTRESIRDVGREAANEVRKGIVDGAERAVEKTAEVPGKIVRDVAKEVAGGGGTVAKQVVGEASRVSREVLGEVKDVLLPPQEPDPKTPPPVPSKKPSSPTPATGDVPVKPAPPELNPSPVDKSAGGADAGDPGGKEPALSTVPSDPSAKPQPPARNKPAQPADPIGQLFDLGHEVTRTVDDVGQQVLGLSWEEEQKVGNKLHRMIAREYVLLRTPALIQRLQRLARPIVDQRSRKELVITLEVIKSDEINAFAHAGGYVYVNTGLLNFAKTDAELQFILAHEIGHQELKHVVKRMTYATRASELGGEAASTLAQMAYMAVALGYSKEHEFEADAWAFRAVLHAGHSRDEGLSAMQHLLAYFNKKDLEPKRSEAQSPAEKTRRQIEQHFTTHPPTAERLQRLEAIETDPTAKP
ncbi:MAG: M48 family metalloprotease [Planctomycetota bacterium]